MANNFRYHIKVTGLFLKAFFFIFLFLCFCHTPVYSQKSNDHVLVLNTDSFQLFFIKPIEFKSKKNKAIYDISFIENKPNCKNEYILRIALITSNNVGKLTSASLCFPEYAICFEEYQLLNFEVKKGKFRYRLEYQIDKKMAEKYINDDTIEFKFVLNNLEINLENYRPLDDQQLIKVVIQNGSNCELL